MFRKLHLLVFLGLLLAGCGDQKALLQQIVPKDDDIFARRFLNSVRAGDYAAAEQMLDGSVRGEKSASGLHSLNAVLAHGEPVSVEVIGCNVFINVSPEGTVRTTNLSYQFHFQDSWAVGNVMVGHPAEGKTVLDSHFRLVPDSLEVLNRFTLAGKSVIHYLVLAVCVAVPLLILVALVVCIRSRIRRKWLWIVFILVGFVQFRLDWASGAYDIQLLSFLVFGASAIKPGLYASWVLGFAIPVGAIVFLIRRRQLLLDDPVQEVKPDEPDSAG